MNWKKATKTILIIFLIIFIFGLHFNLKGNYDIWWHLKSGEMIVKNKENHCSSLLKI